MIFALLNHLFAIPTVLAQQNPSSTSNTTSRTADQLEELVGSILKAFPLWITGGVIIIISFILARIVKSSVENRISEQGLEEEHQEMQIVAGRASSALVLTVGITVGLKIAGIDLTSVLAAGAFGIGFAMKDIIMNFLAGMIVLLQRQFTIGDWIKVGSTVGIIQQIQSRYTVIKAFDGTKIIIPNSDLFKKQVVSYTSNPYRRFSIKLNVDRYADLKEVIDVVYDSIKKIPGILTYPKPKIHVLEPGSFSNNIEIRCWVESRKGILKPKSSLVRQIHKDFYKRGWSWPYPTQNLIFDKDVSPSVNEKAKNYIQKHQKALHEEEGLIHEQSKILAQNTTVTPTQDASANPQTQPIQPQNSIQETTISQNLKQLHSLENPLQPENIANSITDISNTAIQPQAPTPEWLLQQANQIQPTVMPVVVPPIEQEQNPKTEQILPLPDQFTQH